MGIGIIGVIEIEGDILQVTHNKQDFETSTSNYKKVMKNVETKLRHYWEENKSERKSSNSFKDPPSPSHSEILSCITCLLDKTKALQPRRPRIEQSRADSANPRGSRKRDLPRYGLRKSEADAFQ